MIEALNLGNNVSQTIDENYDEQQNNIDDNGNWPETRVPRVCTLTAAAVDKMKSCTCAAPLVGKIGVLSHSQTADQRRRQRHNTVYVADNAHDVV
ncbi:unnamed protein product [Sphagnum balticum]